MLLTVPGSVRLAALRLRNIIEIFRGESTLNYLNLPTILSHVWKGTQQVRRRLASLTKPGELGRTYPGLEPGEVTEAFDLGVLVAAFVVH